MAILTRLRTWLAELLMPKGQSYSVARLRRGNEDAGWTEIPLGPKIEHEHERWRGGGINPPNTSDWRPPKPGGSAPWNH